MLADLKEFSSKTAVVEHVPEFQDLLELIQSKRIQAVLVSDISRLRRVSSWQSLSALDRFARHRCLIITEGQTLDLADPQGALTGGLFALLASHERSTMLRKVNAAREIIRRSGRLPSGEQTLPRGLRYDWKAQQFYYDPDQVAKVREAFRLLGPAGEDLTNLAEVARRVGWKRTGLRGNLENEAWLPRLRRKA